MSGTFGSRENKCAHGPVLQSFIGLRSWADSAPMRRGTGLAPIAAVLCERYSGVMPSKKKAPKVTDILLEIRDEIRNTNSRLDQTNSRLDQTNSRLDQTNLAVNANTTSIEALTTRFDDNNRITVARFESLEHAM